MSKLHHVKITDRTDGKNWAFEIDGRHLKGVRKYAIAGGIHERTEVTVTFIAEQVDLELEGELKQPEVTSI